MIGTRRFSLAARRMLLTAALMGLALSAFASSETRLLDLTAKATISVDQKAELEALDITTTPVPGGDPALQLRLQLSADRLEAVAALPWVQDVFLLPANALAEQPGMRVYKDPVTGKLSSPPPGALILGDMTKGLDTSAEGLTVQKSANGTLTVDLEGRFQSALVATVEDGETAVIQCLHDGSEDASHHHHAAPQADGSEE